MPPEEQRQELGAFLRARRGALSLRTSGSRKASAIAEPLDCGVRSWRIWLGSA